ncbi:hypothetical protein [Sporosarcina sp. FSL K6-3457]|uniref:hypothetical protein n=1 Tax=Sporosarcina sp. FSL K6-3457 TaxID=2978204 RepID=UPI0030FB9A4E
MENRLSVAKHLTDEEYKYLLGTHAKHTGIMGLGERAEYDLSKIVKVERGNGCLHVHYSNGDWWHYTPSGAWY